MSTLNILPSSLPSSTTTSTSPLLQTSGSRGLLFGAAPSASNPSPLQVEAFNAKIAPRRLDMVLLSSSFPNAPIFQYQIDMCNALGLIPQIIWSPNVTLGSMTDGSQDSVLLNAVNRVKLVNSRVIIRLAHEFNISSSTRGYGAETAASFVAGWRYVVSYFKSKGVTNVDWCWCVNVWTSETSTGTVVSPLLPDSSGVNWYPGDDYVDIVGWDGYFYSNMYQRVDFPTLVTPNYTALMAISSKPFMIAETGVGAGVSNWTKSTYQANWFQTLLKQLPRCIGICVWSVNLSANYEYSIDSSGTDAAALAAVVNGVNARPMTAIDGPKKPRYTDFGSGYDGVVNMDGTTIYSAQTPAQPLASSTGTAPNLTYTLLRDVHATVFYIATGITVNTNGFRIFAQQMCYWQGVLQNNGNNATTNTLAGASSSVGSIGVVNAGSSPVSGNGTSNSVSPGLAGGPAGASGAGVSSSSPAKSIMGWPGYGITITSAGSGKVIGFQSRSLAILGQWTGAGGTAWVGGGVGGASGGGDGVNNGGAGGSGGGVVHVAARVILVSGGTASAVGGNGGNALTGNCGGGSGGGGGAVFVVGETIVNSPTLLLTGGSAGSGVGTGTSASAAASTGNYYSILV